MYKKLSILGIILVFAVVFWISADKWINNSGKFDNVGNWLIPLVSLVILSSCISLAFLIIDERRLKDLIFLIVGAPAVVIFGFTQYFPGALAITFLFHSIAIKRVKTELEQRTKINIGIIIKQALPMIILPIFIVISFAYYLSPLVQQSVNEKGLPSSFRSLLTKSVDTVVNTQLADLPAKDKEQAKNEVMNKITSWALNYIAPYSQFIPPVLAFGLFLVLIGFKFIFVWLGTWLAMLFFLILKKTGFVTIIEKDVKAQAIVI